LTGNTAILAVVEVDEAISLGNATLAAYRSAPESSSSADLFVLRQRLEWALWNLNQHATITNDPDDPHSVVQRREVGRLISLLTSASGALYYRRMYRPVLVIGVKGVVCLDDVPGSKEGYHPIDLEAGRVWVADQCRDWLHHLAKNFDLVWLSAWTRTDLSILEADLGLPELPVVTPATDNARLEAVESLLAHGSYDRPAAWIDRGFSHSTDLPFHSGPVKFVRASQGLTSDHVAVLDDFIESLMPFPWD
jgi:hypothetical protein